MQNFSWKSNALAMGPAVARDCSRKVSSGNIVFLFQTAIFLTRVLTILYGGECGSWVSAGPLRHNAGLCVATMLRGLRPRTPAGLFQISH